MDLSLFNSTPMDSPNATNSSPCTRRLSSLVCLTSVCSDRLPSCSLWRRCCSLASRCNLSLALSIELHGEESSIAIHRTALARVQNWNVRIPSFPFVQFKFQYMATRKQTDIHTHASCNAVMLAWGLLRLVPITCKLYTVQSWASQPLWTPGSGCSSLVQCLFSQVWKLSVSWCIGTQTTRYVLPVGYVYMQLVSWIAATGGQTWLNLVRSSLIDFCISTG